MSVLSDFAKVKIKGDNDTALPGSAQKSCDPMPYLSRIQRVNDIVTFCPQSAGGMESQPTGAGGSRPC
ncbi:MAG: hypothetical protein WB697_05195 [Stellaceae bacterium]